MQLTSVSPSALSTFGGKVQVVGTGLPSAWSHKDYTIELVSNSKTYDLQVLSTAVGALTLSVP